MTKRQILLVEQEPSIARAIEAGLTQFDQFQVKVVSTGLEALRALHLRLPDALLLDTTVPDVPATEMCRVVRSRERSAHLPLILISDRAVLSPIIGLGLGADDYVPKPFDVRELEARLRAVLRRRTTHPRELEADGFKGQLLQADFNAVDVRVSGRRIVLTRLEFKLLRILVHARNHVMDRRTLLLEVWDDKRSTPRTIDSVIFRLRTKLLEAGRQIETVAGLGYRFREPPEHSVPSAVASGK